MAILDSQGISKEEAREIKKMMIARRARDDEHAGTPGPGPRHSAVRFWRRSHWFVGRDLDGCTPGPRRIQRASGGAHALWLGVLVWVLLSPIAACVADRSGFALWFLPLPLPEPTIRAAVEETVATPAVDQDLGPGGDAARGVIAGNAGSDADAGAARPVVEEAPRSVPVVAME